MDLGTMVARVAEEVHEPADSSVIRSHVISALSHFRGKRFRFSEKHATFAFTASTSDYALDESSDAPADLLQIDEMWRLEGSSKMKIQVVSLGELREMQSIGNTSEGYTAFVAEHARTLIFYPTPAQAWTVEVDYLFDCTRDRDTGELIMQDSEDGTTNDLFILGESMLRWRVLAEYCLGRAEWEVFGFRAKKIADSYERDARLESYLRVNNMQASRFGY